MRGTEAKSTHYVAVLLSHVIVKGSQMAETTVKVVSV